MAEAALLNQRFALGDRVADVEGHRATVRYVGAVDGYPGEWVGLEWDAPGRGKHDGTVKGKRYFGCPEGQGSLAREHKLKRGISLVEALREKYGAGVGDANSDTVASAGSGDMFVTTSSGRRVQVEIVGMDFIESEIQKQLDRLGKLYLPESLVSYLGADEELRSSGLLDVTEVDLSGSLISSWEEVARLEQLRKLELLNLSRLRFASAAPSTCLPSFASLRTLVLNACKISWDVAMEVAAACPMLEALHLCDNSLSKLQGPSAEFVLQRLQLLNLEDNDINSWEEVAATLKGLPKLERLYLSGNTIDSIPAPGSADFASLRTLLLARNRINQWAAVDALNKFAALSEVRLGGNPLLQDAGEVGGRMTCIARIGSLQVLNGSEVRDQERQDAEIKYLKEIEQYKADQGDSTINMHPRYWELVGKHGRLASCQPLPKDTTLGNSLLVVTFRCTLETCTKPPVTKKLPGSVSVSKLKVICHKLFGIEIGTLSLAVQYPDCGHLLQLEHDNDSLQYVGVPTGSTLLVSTLST